ncbi:MAG: pectin acetylesterase-family hydrolase [Pseudomonadota bacterium]
MTANSWLRKATKIVAYTVLGLVAVTALAVYWLNHGYVYPEAESLADMDDSRWYRLKLGQKLLATDGSELTALVRKGDTDKLIVFFQGGGMAWDADSAAKPIRTFPLIRTALFKGIDGLEDAGFYNGEMMWLLMYIQGGLFSFDRQDNPFRDWSIVYIPYGSGDLHSGDTITEYITTLGERVELQHRGAANADAVLAWTYDSFPDPDKVLVAGSSAGAFGATVWLGPIARHYDQAQVYGYADGIYLDQEKVAEASRTNWGPTLAERFGFTMQSKMLDSLYQRYLEDPLPNVIYLHSNTTRDEVIAMYMMLMSKAELTDKPRLVDEWSLTMMTSARKWRESPLPYYSFITDHGDGDGLTQHTFLQFGAVYTHVEDSVTPMEWLKAAVIDDAPFSVGTSLLVD